MHDDSARLSGQRSTGKEYLFVDESGDPGPKGDPTYIVALLHSDESGLRVLREHLTNFRYMQRTTGELKGARWAKEPIGSGPSERLLSILADLVANDVIAVTANWLNKATYKAGRGPYLNPGDHAQFRHFQLAMLLERHRRIRQWDVRTDLVLDRWLMTPEQEANLLAYIAGNYKIRPVFEHITLVDSAYSDFIQLVDLIARLVRRCVVGTASQQDKDLLQRVVDIQERRAGRYMRS